MSDLASCSAINETTVNDETLIEDLKISRKKWERFSNWVHCICVVTFDLELGQAIELVYPSHVKLTEQERSNICYLAFPDSNSGCMGDTQYHVRIRQNGKTTHNTQSLKEYDRKCPVFVQSDRDYYWGYVYFRQVKDKTLPRGYFQKSIVIITKLPLVNLFSEICALIAPEFFESGMSVMEAVSREIDRWPPPVPGQILHLILMNVLFQTYIPNQNYKATVPTVAALDHTTKKHSLRKIVLTSAYEGDMFRSLASVVSHVHLLWELALLGEPIVVMASSPTTCAEMVQALTATIAPLKYCADHRPYFTIHDSEFKEYTTDAPSPPAVILGVTNPFFAKTLQHWPHIIRITNGSNVENQKYRIKKSENLKVLDSKPGVYTQYKPFLQKDKAILKKLLRGIQTKRPGEVQTALLRRHLLELTESFMIPLERYIASLMPLQKNISPFKATPIPQLFNPDDFLATLSSAGPQLTTGIKGDWVGLYRRFFRSPNFSGWFHTRYTELTQKLQAIQLEALSEADLKTWVQGKQEVEVVDMILRIRQKLDKSYEDDVPISHSVQEKLNERINDIIYTLPDDLQIILSVKS
ncbi:protein DENND6A [Neodiprion pinetum]|uniref:Protein DENND6A n=1 Tax=Neodiprion lecontei TaxID=441921 RepID=A0A6J0BNU3_NEOLC|nr:protein DENND6A [Neodiprion lecontei]XP_046484111.1 protein DENND6A [Neodiprion pinetum]